MLKALIFILFLFIPINVGAETKAKRDYNRCVAEATTLKAAAIRRDEGASKEYLLKAVDRAIIEFKKEGRQINYEAVRIIKWMVKIAFDNKGLKPDDLANAHFKNCMKHMKKVRA